MEHVLSARLELKDKFTAVVNKAEKGLAGLYQKAKSMNWEKVNSGLNKFGAVAAGGLVGLGAIAGSSLTAFADLEDQVRRNKAIMGATAAEENMLMTQTRELGRSTKFTAQEVAQAQMYQAMAGMKTNEVLEMTPKLLKLSIASGEDLASTSDLLTDNISAFGLKLQDADRFMDVMAATANNTNTSIAQLGEAYKYVASTSRNFESLEETNIILGLLADSGLKGSIAGRNLASIYARLSKTTPDMDAALKKVGVTLYDNNGKFKGLRKILEELKPKLAHMSDEQRNYFLTTIAGSEGLKVMNNLLGTSKEGIEKAENAIKNATGATDRFAKEMSDNTKDKLAQFRSAVDDLKISIGEGLAPTATDFINKFTSKMAELNSKGTFNTENVEAYFNKIFNFLSEAIQGFAALKAAAMAESIFAGAGLPVIGGFVGWKLGRWIDNKTGLSKSAAEGFQVSSYTNKYMKQGYSREDADKQARLDVERESKMRGWKSEDYKKQIETEKNQIILSLDESQLNKLKNNTIGLRALGLSSEDLKQQEILLKNRSINSLNSPLPKKPKSEYEKSFENLGFKAPIASTTNFSPQVNIETDKNKILETKKEDIPTISPIINLKNDKDKFINNKILNPQVKDVSNKKEEPKKEIIKTATPSYDKLTSKLISAFEEQRKNVKTVVENKTLNYIAKPSEKIRVPEVKQGNNDIKVPPQNVTFSPQINLNMGGVVIKNEADVEKVAELSKQKIMKNLMTYVQTTN